MSHAAVGGTVISTVDSINQLVPFCLHVLPVFVWVLSGHSPVVCLYVLVLWQTDNLSSPYPRCWVNSSSAQFSVKKNSKPPSLLPTTHRKLSLLAQTTGWKRCMRCHPSACGLPVLWFRHCSHWAYLHLMNTNSISSVSSANLNQSLQNLSIFEMTKRLWWNSVSSPLIQELLKISSVWNVANCFRAISISA